MSPRPPVGRFAPSTTGRAHPGTLLAAFFPSLRIRSMKPVEALRGDE